VKFEESLVSFVSEESEASQFLALGHRHVFHDTLACKLHNRYPGIEHNGAELPQNGTWQFTCRRLCQWRR
jgi:hypothetical protein